MVVVLMPEERVLRGARGAGVLPETVDFALSHAHDLVLVADLTLTMEFVSIGAHMHLGHDPADLVGKNGLDYLHPDDIELFAAAAFHSARERYIPRASNLFRLLQADGTYRTMEVAGGPYERDGEIAGFWMVARPPVRSEVYAAVLHRLLEEQPLSRALEVIPADMFPEFGARICITCWPEAEDEFTVGDRLPAGLNGRDRRAGTPWAIAIDTGAVFVANHLDELDPTTAELAAREELDTMLVLPIAAADGEVRGLLTVWGEKGSPPAASIMRVSDVVGDLIAAALRIRGRFDDLQKTARSDPLTGLANRAAFEEALAAHATTSEVAILYIDLDYFKTVNDTHGHLVGDQLLEIVGRRLGGAVRDRDLVARLGGDEFAVFCPSCDSDEAVRIAQRILEAVATPVTIEGNELAVGASIGVAHAAVAADDLLRRADDALYEAKNAGRGTVQVSRTS